jgi:citrate/tricarballylate utilization protein
MTQARVESFASYARPRIAWRILSRPWPLAGLTIVSIALFLALAAASRHPERFLQSQHGPGAFYDEIAYSWLLVLGFGLGGLAVVAMIAGLSGFIRQTGGLRAYLSPRAHVSALAAALRLTNLHGGGGGCAAGVDDTGAVRRRLHHLVAYGFAAMFVSTTAAAIDQEVVGREPPYSLVSVPVLFGLLGGIATIIGCVGFAVLRATDVDRTPQSAEGNALSRLFGVSLALTTLSGILVLAFRSTSALGALLLVHLALVSVLFISLPYSKFVHWIYRYAALVKSEVESRARRSPGE